MILHFLAVEEEGNVQTLLAQRHGRGHSDGDALVGGAIQHGALVADLLHVGAGVELAQLGDLVAGLDVTSVDEIGDLAAGLGGEIAKLQYASIFEELDKLMLVSFHGTISFIFSK